MILAFHGTPLARWLGLCDKGQEYFFVEIKSPKFCKMKYKSRGEKGALFWEV